MLNFIKEKCYFSLFVLLFLCSTVCDINAQRKQNIALRRAVHHSNAVNFDATGHLVTDGIYTASSFIPHVYKDQHGDSPSGETPDFAFDGKSSTKWLSFHPTSWLQVQLAEGKSFAIAGYTIISGDDAPERDPKNWTVEGSTDGVNYTVLDKREDQKFGARKESKKYQVANQGTYSYFRLNITSNNGDRSRVQLTEWSIFDKDGKPGISSPEDDGIFDSRWISASNKDEWVYVDLGASSRIDEVVFHWGNARHAVDYSIQISDDAKNWSDAYSQKKGSGGKETCSINRKARYVRLYCKQSAGNDFSLIEMEVMGSNSLKYNIGSMPKALPDGTQYLRGGNWRLQRASEVKVGARTSQMSLTERASEIEGIGKALAQAGYDDSGWLPAIVPGTVLTSFLTAGAIPDPNYSDWQTQISDSYFTTDFWYRNKFEIPAGQKGKTTWLNFDAINWKADVYFNGSFLGKIEGAFMRGNFDITKLANYGGDNYLAVFIHKNQTPGPVTIQTLENPGKNGGVLGADNPTIHASVGWDWVPTIRGRNTGVYNDVYLSYTQDAKLQDPWIIVDLDTENKDFSKASLTVKTELVNAQSKPVNVVVKGKIQPGNISFESSPVTLQGSEVKEVDIAKDLIMKNPRLWWPVTYGEPFLYTAELTAYVDGKQSDKKEFRFGVREYTYDKERPMTIYCNGTRIVCRGGNWGMDDSNLAATEEDYDIKVRLHAEANLTMIRNWVGMTGNEAFYHACDKYGVLIWDDFWLANPGDGPNPDDEDLFMRNAIDKIKRNRYHAAVALYCGRNEGDPPRTLNAALDAATLKYDGTRYYIPHSAAGNVSGFGPYTVQDSEWYYRNTGRTLHSERGMPNVPSLESMQKFLPVEHQWPIDVVWGLHDFTMDGAQGGKNFMNKMQRYGSFNDLPSFVRYAQMVNYEGHKSMFEAVYTNRANGMLMWMSQSAWPSMVWQTYDYYYDTNGGYFGLKKANQPLNAIFNPATKEIVLVNATPDERKDLTIKVNIFDLKGKPVRSDVLKENIEADGRRVISKVDTTALIGIVFIKTHILDKQGKELADNFTWINASDRYKYSEMSTLSQAQLKASYKAAGKTKAGEVEYQMTIVNTGDVPAVMVRVKTMADKTNEQLLPVYYQDNYFSLMPGESKTISITFDEKYLKGSKPVFYIEGWNNLVNKVL